MIDARANPLAATLPSLKIRCGLARRAEEPPTGVAQGNAVSVPAGASRHDWSCALYVYPSEAVSPEGGVVAASGSGGRSHAAASSSGQRKTPPERGFPGKRLKRLELSTFCMASRRSSQLSYSRKVRGVYPGRCGAEARPRGRRSAGCRTSARWPGSGTRSSRTRLCDGPGVRSVGKIAALVARSVISVNERRRGWRTAVRRLDERAGRPRSFRDPPLGRGGRLWWCQPRRASDPRGRS
jgi:hypothetical protein